MRANRGRKFKAPRLLKDKETAKQDESDDDDIPFSEIIEKVRAETKGSDSEEDNIPFSQIKTKTTISSDNRRKDRPSPGRVNTIRLLSEREADETAKYGEVQTWSDDDGDTARRVPLSLARDFGDRGIYLGEVIRIEYDSDDEHKVCIQTKGSP
jgi:hypothetical protein